MEAQGPILDDLDGLRNVLPDDPGFLRSPSKVDYS